MKLALRLLKTLIAIAFVIGAAATFFVAVAFPLETRDLTGSEQLQGIWTAALFSGALLVLVVAYAYLDRSVGRATRRTTLSLDAYTDDGLGGVLVFTEHEVVFAPLKLKAHYEDVRSIELRVLGRPRVTLTRADGERISLFLGIAGASNWPTRGVALAFVRGRNPGEDLHRWLRAHRIKSYRGEIDPMVKGLAVFPISVFVLGLVLTLLNPFLPN